jgi:hypothetical protein
MLTRRQFSKLIVGSGLLASAFVDTGGKKRTGRQKLQHAATIRAGRLYVNHSEDSASL